MSAMTLRPYQREGILATRALWAQYIRNLLGVAATGAGKTQILLGTLLGHEDIPPLLVDGKRGLIIAHRDELIRQPHERIANYWKEWLPQVGIVKAEENQPHRQLTIATVQSLHEKRLKTLLHYGKIDYLVIDEAHHAVADSYVRLYETLKAANPEMCHLGVTATPQRADDTGLIEVYERNSFSISIKDLVRAGYLVPFKGLEIATKVSLKGVHRQGADLNQGQLKRAFELDNVLDLVVQSHQKYAAGRKAIAFTVSVDGAHDLADRFTAAGIPAAAIDGTTPKDERRAILRRFSVGEIMVLTNCAVLTEGFDQPDVSCVHMVRPTMNRSLFVQCVGRGLRTAPGKEDCLILEYAPSQGHNLASMGDVLGLPRDVTERTQQQADAEETDEGDVLGGMSFDGDVRGLEGDPLELVARQLDYLSLTPFHWDRREGWLVLGLGRGADGRDRILAITPPMLTDPFVLYGLVKDEGSYQWQVRKMAESDDFAALSEQANELAESRGVGILTGKNASWKHQPATEGQIKFLRRLVRGEGEKIKYQLLNKGDAASLITFYQAKQTLERAGAWR